MEDRHNLSEARPVPGLELPTWDVDVLREGVDTPIMTLRIDERALPPRRGGGGRKKNSKVVWKLPDTLEQIPKFGREDKARILEIFKLQKKTLKREKKNKSSSSSPPQEEGEEPNDDTGETAPLPSPSPSPSPTKGGKYPPPPPPDDDDEDDDSNEKFFTADVSKKESSFSGPPGFQSLSVEEKKQSEIMEGKNPRPPPPPGLSTPAGGPLIPSASASASSFSATEASSLSSIPFSPPSQPPPGILHPMPPGLPQTAVSYSLKNAPLPPPPPGMQPTNRAASTSTSPTKQSPLTSLETTISPQPQPQTPPLRYFQLPPGSTPISSSTSSSSSSSSSTTTNNNHLAQVVTQSYYYMLTHGHVQELKAHYAPVGAAKSLTVGGAHAICHSLSDMELQLQSLVGMVVAIRGVLQQSIPITAALACPSSSSDGNVHNNNKNNSSNHASMILLVITGMCVRPHALPFCHSLVLTPVVVDAARQHGGGEGEGGGGGGGGATTTTTTTTNPTTIIGYQIQNDALCFLTTEAVVTAAAASPSP